MLPWIETCIQVFVGLIIIIYGITSINIYFSSGQKWYRTVRCEVFTGKPTIPLLYQMIVWTQKGTPDYYSTSNLFIALSFQRRIQFQV